MGESERLTNFDLIKICQKTEVGFVEFENSFNLPHELLEVAINLYLAEKYCCETAKNIFESLNILVDLEKLENQIPVTSWGSSEQQLLQQFSTQPSFAFLMAKILNSSAMDLILESSAGTGSLNVWLQATGCNFILTNYRIKDALC